MWGLAYLGEIANSTPSAANVRRYGEIIRERAILRKLVSVGDQIAASALTPSGKDAKTLLDEAEAKVFEIAEAGRGRSVASFPFSPFWGRWWTGSRSCMTATRLRALPVCRRAC
jgi:replicative DNA helicase